VELTRRKIFWLSCGLCNQYKGIKIKGFDQKSQSFVPLFNPRKQVWKKYFVWSADETQIVGLTPIGRATV
jgi:hypothetical protein